MKEQINAYLDAVCAEIKCREVHAEVRLELESHIGERVDALVAGFLTVFAMSYVWNIAMHAGWMPLATVDLPFISAGRQQVVQLAAVGLMLSVFRRKDLGVSLQAE